MSLEFPVTWRLRECMRNANIETVTELHNRIKAIAPDAIKYAQLARIVESAPARLNLQTLTILTIVLGCSPGDILNPRTEDATAAAPPTKKQKRS